MNKVYIIFETVEDAEAAAIVLNGKIPYINGASTREFCISAGDRREAMWLLNGQKLNYIMR